MLFLTESVYYKSNKWISGSSGVAAHKRPNCQLNSKLNYIFVQSFFISFLL